jgi:glycosyltransferase involved in cell wall biosynthesis
MPKNILIYYPSNSRAVDQQSVMELICKMGHRTFLLTHLPKGKLHENTEDYGVEAHSVGLSKNNGIIAYLKHIAYLIKFIRVNNINIVFSHLQAAGFVASIANVFVKFKHYYIRHNTDEHLLSDNKNAVIVNYLTNHLAKTIIAPSDTVYDYLTKTEKIDVRKVIKLNYGYNFEQYQVSDKFGLAKQIRKEFDCKMLIVSVARLIPVKRHILMFEIIKELIDERLDIKFICISEGYYRHELETYIQSNNLESKIYLLGTKNNIFDYLEASDLFFHLSETEASNSAVKEAALCNVPAIVCKDVGDFSDYIKTDYNGFLIDKLKPKQQALEAIKKCYNNNAFREEIGKQAAKTVEERFSIENLRTQYEKLIE